MINNIKQYFILAMKGFAMGAANVIPGVSGGTIALVTGVFEKLIHSVRSIDHIALGFLLKGNFRSFSSRINLYFLIAVFSGAVMSVFTLARLLGYLFNNFPVFVWAYFFGLILASVYFVGRRTERWSLPVLMLFATGALLAVWVSRMSPAEGSENTFYLILCGAVAVSSMILPGLSGSFILILMGNYELVAIEAINDLRTDILLPVLAGIIAGLIVFSHFLSWIFRKFRDHTLGAMTGFIAGSLYILWPWKIPVYRTDGLGNLITRIDGSPIIESYHRFVPAALTADVLVALLLMILGFLSIWLIEKIAEQKA